jgi:hypothetical protein
MADHALTADTRRLIAEALDNGTLDPNDELSSVEKDRLRAFLGADADADLFEVSVLNTFEATDAEDAVRQMVEWLVENAPRVGYRVTREGLDQYEFIDALDEM